MRGIGVEHASCKKWFDLKCQNIANEEYANKQDVVWICTYCCNPQTQGHVDWKKGSKGRWMTLSAVGGDPDQKPKLVNS